MAENQARKRIRHLAADELWRRSHLAAGSLRRCDLLSLTPGPDGRPVIWLRGLLPDLRYLQQLTTIEKIGVPGPLEEAFAAVLPQYTDWPRFRFELVNDLPRVA